MSDRTNKPVHEVRIGAIKAAIWANASTSGGGSTRYAVTVARIYRDRNSQWQQTTSFGVDDLPVLQKVIDQAFEAVLNLQADTPAPDSNSEGNDGGDGDTHAETVPTGNSGNSREAQASGASRGGGKARKRG